MASQGCPVRGKRGIGAGFFEAFKIIVILSLSHITVFDVDMLILSIRFVIEVALRPRIAWQRFRIVIQVHIFCRRGINLELNVVVWHREELGKHFLILLVA